MLFDLTRKVLTFVVNENMPTGSIHPVDAARGLYYIVFQYQGVAYLLGDSFHSHLWTQSVASSHVEVQAAVDIHI